MSGVKGVVEVNGQKNEENVGLEKGNAKLQKGNGKDQGQGKKGQEIEPYIGEGHGKGGKYVEKGVAGHDVGKETNGEAEGPKGIGNDLYENNEGLN